MANWSRSTFTTPFFTSRFFSLSRCAKNKKLELLQLFASNPVCQLGIKMTARVSWTKFLNFLVHVTRGGHFRSNVGLSNYFANNTHTELHGAVVTSVHTASSMYCARHSAGFFLVPGARSLDHVHDRCPDIKYRLNQRWRRSSPLIFGWDAAQYPAEMEP